ncbi:hypothetical protein [Streptomyces sp. EN23]|uniref:hypothetical protein n=1 Tax=Streptomyces sp. EN23 TaxID=212774 RepID=UPI0008517F27|nr:hypothetical protein [Streptomyces sp. EN23]
MHAFLDRPDIRLLETASAAFLDRPDIRLLETASAVAVLGDYGGTEMVAKLTGIDPDAVSGMMDALDLAGLLAG